MTAEPPPAPPDGAPPQRFEFATTNPDEAQDFIEQMWAARPPKAGRRLDRISPVAISQVRAGGMSYVDFTMPPDLTLHLDGTEDLSVTTLISGGTQAELGQDTERYTAGDVCLGSFPRGDYLVRCLEFRAGILTVPAAALAQAAGALPDQPNPPAAVRVPAAGLPRRRRRSAAAVGTPGAGQCHRQTHRRCGWDRRSPSGGG